MFVVASTGLIGKSRLLWTIWGWLWECAKLTTGCLEEGSKAGKGDQNGSGKSKYWKMERRIKGGNHKPLFSALFWLRPVTSHCSLSYLKPYSQLFLFFLMLVPVINTSLPIQQVRSQVGKSQVLARNQTEGPRSGHGYWNDLRSGSETGKTHGSMCLV